MKKILTLLSFLIAVQLSAQTHWTDINNYQKIRGVWHDSVDIMPRDTAKNKAEGSLAYKTIPYYYNGTKWVPVGSGVIAFDSSILRGVYMDTAYMLEDSIIVFCKGGTCWNDTIHGSGGSPNTNIGLGYRLAVDGTNDIITVFSTPGILIDSTTNTDGLTFSIDTNNITFDGDTTIVNNFITNKSLLIPRTDTVNAKQKNGSIIFDTIYRHYMGYVDGDWFCLDCDNTGVQSVTGLNTDNTDPLNPIVQISVDGSTITGQGTPGSPLVANVTGAQTWQQALTQSPDFTQNNTSNFHNYNWRIDSIGALNLYSGRYDLLKRSGNIHLDSSTASLYAQVNDTVRANVFAQSNADSAYFYLPATNNLKSLSLLGTTNGRFRMDATNIAISSTNTFRFNDTATIFEHSGVNTPPKIVVRNSSQLNTASPTTYAVFQNDTLKSIASLPSASGFWPLQTGTLPGALTGQDTIFSNAPNQLHFKGTFTASAALQYYHEYSPSITGDATASRSFNMLHIAPTFTWGANNQEFSAIYIDPTFSQGAFTGTGISVRYALKHNGSIMPLTTNAWSIGKIGNIYSGVFTNAIITNNIQNLSAGATINVLDQSGLTMSRIFQGGAVRNYSSIGQEWNDNINLHSSATYMGYFGGELFARGAIMVGSVSTPAAPSAGVSGGTGTSYTYKVVGRLANGATTDASAGTTVSAGATLNGSNFVTISVSSNIEGIRFWDIYRTASSGTPSTTGKIGTFTANNLQLVDNGLAGDGSTPPSSNTTGRLGIGTTTPAAALDVTSTTQGALLPRMTKAQRDAIVSPPTGTMIYQTDNTPGLRTWNGTNWMRYTETAD